jgi:hypothetical protein
MRNHSPRLLSTAIACALLASTLLTSGCVFSGDVSAVDGIVRSEQADVYSSTALVALKVATLKRGDTVEILGSQAVTGATSTEQWLQIRLKGDEETSGWIEARHVVSQPVVDKTKEIAGDGTTDQPFARGRLKVNQKLRLAPGRDSEVAVVLARGTEFEVVGKEQTRFTPERKKAEPDEDEAPDTPEEEPETKTDTWYRVRLDEGAIVRGGWLLANSVSLEVPDEILHLEGDGRRFVAWHVVGSVVDQKLASRSPNEAKRNHYATFQRRATVPDEVDFERIYFLFWDVDIHAYRSSYVESDMRGAFPISQRTEGNKRILTAHVLDAANRKIPVEFEVFVDEKGRTLARRITPPVMGERLSSQKR